MLELDLIVLLLELDLILLRLRLLLELLLGLELLLTELLLLNLLIQFSLLGFKVASSSVALALNAISCLILNLGLRNSGLKDRHWLLNYASLDDRNDLSLNDGHLNLNPLVLGADDWLWHLHNSGDFLIDLFFDWNDLLLVARNVLLHVNWLGNWDLYWHVDWYLHPSNYWDSFADLDIIRNWPIDRNRNLLLVELVGLALNKGWLVT